MCLSAAVNLGPEYYKSTFNIQIIYHNTVSLFFSTCLVLPPSSIFIFSLSCLSFRGWRHLLSVLL